MGAKAAVLAALLPLLLFLSASIVPCAEVLNVEGEITSMLVRDQDGDGLKEIWVSYHEGGQRFLGVFRGAASYSNLPDLVVPVDPQAILFSVGDYDPFAGLDLLFISRTSGVLYPLAAGDVGGGVRKLFDAELFFSTPSCTAIPAWLSGSKLDMDGDGAEDLVIPEKRELRLFFAASRGFAGDGSPRSPWRAAASLPIAYYLLTGTREEKVSRVVEDFAEEDKSPPPILDTTGAYPFPVFQDFDGDRRLDLIVKQPGYRLEVFRQASPGAFSPVPDLKLEAPWTKDATSLELADLNGDRKLDAVAARLLLKDLATEVQVFVQDPSQPGQGFEVPRQILRVQGFFRSPVLADLDRDGRLDLLVSTYRVDLLDQLKKSAVDEVELTHEIYAGGAETPFERRPSYQEKFLLRTRDLEGGNPRASLFAGHDLTGDGRPDILFIDGGRSLRLHRSVAGKPLRFEEDPAFTERIEDPIALEIADLDVRGGEELILRYERRLEVHRGR